MSSEIIQIVAYDNYEYFQHANFIISQIFISLFWGLFIDKTDITVSYLSKEFQTLVGAPSSPSLDSQDLKIPTKPTNVSHLIQKWVVLYEQKYSDLVRSH
jgi:hypothetical protein